MKISSRLLTPVILSTAITLLGAAALFKARSHAQPPIAQKKQAPSGTFTHLDLVLALDTSSSMNGLIDGARQQLWDTVAQLGRMEPKPTLRVGLISYGNSGYDAASGWVRIDSDLTTDLDAIYQQLFALRTNGGDEYVARALQTATTRFAWSSEPGTRRMFIVAGNESADQDPKVSLKQAMLDAQALGIQVNSIYCGSESNRESTLWRALAIDGHGKYAAIDHNADVAVATPVDNQLAALSAALNNTYVAYGARGAGRASNQAAQDKNAATLGATAAAARAVAKSSALYKNAEWDLVDAAKDGKLSQINEGDLPEELRKLSPTERTAFLQKKAAEREELNRKISELSSQRMEYKKSYRAKSPSKGKSLDSAMDALF